MVLPEQMINEFRTAGEDSTSIQRLGLWSFGMDVARDNPVLGVGYENWVDYCNFIDPVIPEVPRCMVAHNAYVTVVAETGYVGLVLYILLAVFILIQNASTRANARQLDNKLFLYTALALDAGLIGYLASSMFYSVSWYPFIWVQLAMTVALHEISRNQLCNSKES
jgi:O-antigen ligase